MAYAKNEWQCGDTITADLLNHMEQGIEDASGGGVVVIADMSAIYHIPHYMRMHL